MRRNSDKKKKNVAVSLREFKTRIKMADLNTFFIFGSIALVLVIGLYAMFFAQAGNVRFGNPACGNIVIAAEGPSLSAAVSPTLSGARYFLVVNPLSKKLLEAAKNPYADLQAPPGADVAYFVAGKGEEAVIATRIEPGCYNVLSNMGIRCFGGYTGKAVDVVDLYRQARIAQSTPGNMGGSVLNRGARVALGLGPFLFRCPRCNWGTNALGTWNAGPVCPNCGIWTTRSDANLAGLGEPTVPVIQPRIRCPTCNWCWYPQASNGQFPRCPNCLTIVPMQGVPNLGPQNPGRQAADVQPLISGTGSETPPIYPDAKMPHAYRGVCSNCHQIIRSTQSNGLSQNAGVALAAFGRQYNSGSTCIVK